jgi:hypothetical protein
MSSDYTGSPKFLKGALAAFDSQIIGGIPNIIIFQFNPEQLSRSLSLRTPPTSGEQNTSAKSETLKVSGPPVESIKLSVVLDAADQLNDPLTHPLAVTMGISPALSALEMLLYPPEEKVLENKVLAEMGSSDIEHPDAPLVLFIWGPTRVVPVQLTDFSITEEAFDQLLNPMRAKVELGLKVLTYMELKEESLGYGAYKATLTQKQIMAASNIINNIEQVMGMLPI